MSSLKNPRLSRIALSIIGALAATAACIGSTTAVAALGDPVTGQIQVCIEDPAGLASYVVNTTEGATTGPAIGTADAVPPGSLLIKVQTCAVVATSNVSGGITAFNISLVLAGAKLQAVSCINLNGSKAAVDCIGPDVILDVNGFHGSVVKFHVLPVGGGASSPPLHSPVR